MSFGQLATITASTHRKLQQSTVKAVNQYQIMQNGLIGFYMLWSSNRM